MSNHNKRLDRLEHRAGGDERIIVCWCIGECTCEASPASDKDTVVRVVEWDEEPGGRRG